MHLVTPALPTDWKKLRPHKLQARAYYAPEKFIGLACGRGSGKSLLAKYRISRALVEKTLRPKPIYFYLLPTFSQAKRVAWIDLLDLIPKQWIKHTNITDMTIETHYGSTLHVLSGDVPARIEGVQWDGGIVDESCDYKPGLWDRSLLPALTHHCRFCWRIGVPKRFGSSAPEFYRWFVSSAANKFCAAWPSSDILSAATIDEVKAELSNADFQEQFNATWLSASGGVYIEFSETANVHSAAVYAPERPIFVGCDFNVDPMSWVLAHYVNGNIIIFDCIKLHGTTTQRTLDRLWSLYSNHKAGWVFTGDAASRQRSTTSDFSDYLIINNDLRFGEKGIVFPDSNPSLTSRFATVNAALCTSDGKRHVFIHPSCKALIDDLKQQAYKPNTSDIDYSNKTIGHMSDGFGYLTMYLRPMPLHHIGETQLFTKIA